MSPKDTRSVLEIARGKRGPRRATPEADMQVALVGLLDGMTDRYPELKLLFAVNPNLWNKVGKAAAGRMKAMGLRKGPPDLWLPVRREGYVGLVLELKSRGEQPTAEQELWLDRLHEQGWLAMWADELNTAVNLVVGYLALPPARPLERPYAEGRTVQPFVASVPHNRSSGPRDAETPGRSR